MQRSSRSSDIAAILAIVTSLCPLAVGVVAAAASDNAAQTKAASPAPGDACSLLTKQDAGAALGEAVSGPEVTSARSMGPGSTAWSCEYSGAGLHKVQLVLIRMSPDLAAMYKAKCAKKGREGLAGLGDMACWYNDKHEELQVLKGTTFLSIKIQRSGDPTEAIKGVMKKALDRL